MEKTFEELIIEKFSEDGLIKMSFSRNEMIDLMQQVREATIAECRKIALYEDDPVLIWNHIKKLPTDRIIEQTLKEAKCNHKDEYGNNLDYVYVQELASHFCPKCKSEI